ncbi:MAG: cytochrome c biogenesis protein CcsA [Anaerolineales bacterium]
MSPQPPALKLLNILSVILVPVAFGIVVFYAPMEQIMGLVQKVFYFHVATAWVGMLGFTVAAVVAVIYLRTKDMKWDMIELAAVEISLVFFLIAIVLGSIWARPIWNTWWTWEPRLSTAAFLELFYLAYLLLRDGVEDPERRARFGAVYTLIGVIAVPITFLSIRVLRSIHPVVFGSAGDTSMGMTGEMYFTMFFSIIVFSIVFVTLFWHRIRLGQLTGKVEELKLKLTE